MSSTMRTTGLRGTKPKSKQGRLKAFIYGEAGSGKSYFCTQFSKPYYIDTEKGVERSKYVENIENRDGVVFQTRSFTDIYQEVWLLATTTHDYQTLIIDPITPVYNNLVQECLEKVERTSKSGKSGHGRHYMEANNKFQKLIDLLLLIDMNIIITSHAKKEYGSEMEVTGTTFDAYKKFDHVFDVVIETSVKKGKYTGIAKKSRLASLEPHQQIDFSYNNFSQIFKAELEYFTPKKVVISESEKEENIVHTPISEETKNHLNFLFEHMRVPLEKKNRIIEWAKVNKLSELSEQQATVVIRKLEKEEPKAAEEWIKIQASKSDRCKLEDELYELISYNNISSEALESLKKEFSVNDFPELSQENLLKLIGILKGKEMLNEYKPVENV